MNTEEIYKRIDAKKKEDLAEAKKRYDSLPDEEPQIDPVDLYQRNRDRAHDVGQKAFPRGSSAVVNMAVNAVLDGMGSEGLIKAFNRAKEDVEALKARGEKGRAEIRKRQYMDEDFLPALEIVVNSTSPDEVLNSEKALGNLDEYVLLEGSGKGYTASYIRQAYGDQLGQQTGRSDASVQSGVMRLNSLLSNGEIRSAFSVAKDLKEKIDRGDAQADDIDYDLIGRVLAYYS